MIKHNFVNLRESSSHAITCFSWDHFDCTHHNGYATYKASFSRTEYNQTGSQLLNSRAAFPCSDSKREEPAIYSSRPVWVEQLLS